MYICMYKFVAKSPAIKEQLLDLVKVNGPTP